MSCVQDQRPKGTRQGVTYERRSDERDIKEVRPVFAQALHPWQLGERGDAGKYGVRGNWKI